MTALPAHPRLSPDEYEDLRGFYLDRVESQGAEARAGYEQLVAAIGPAAGQLVVPTREPDPHLPLLLSAGRRLPSRPARLVDGEPNQCHLNSAAYFDADPHGLRIETGYALSDDGLWRSHTWVRRLSDGCVLDTTSVRDAYWGVPLSPLGGLVFCLDEMGTASEKTLLAAEEFLAGRADGPGSLRDLTDGRAYRPASESALVALAELVVAED